ncbi:MAG: alpha-L-glutamate ligase-like protein [Oceanicoccus sp.]
MFASPGELKRKHVLGMNSRNIEYIARYNPRHLYPLVDDKLKTKVSAQKAGIAVPQLLAVIKSQWQLRDLENIIGQWQKFVIKPTRGSGGKGIVVITGRDAASYVKPNGTQLDLPAIRRHISNILSGLYSLGGKPDSVMFESLIEYDAVFNDFTYEGVPDLRIIVFKGFPVMAMLRCSTHASDGRANLHQGAIGVGIDMATGQSLFAVQHDKPVSRHPDTGRLFSELVIPQWKSILELAAGCFEMTGLGYIGCDIVLDKHQGPVILELNARPGLAIQLASGRGLIDRLRLVENLAIEMLELPVDERVRLCQSWYQEI